MKYRLINKQTGKEHICDKVTIDGFDYYVSDEIAGFTYNKPTYNSDGRIGLPENNQSRIVIATNSQDSNIPKVVNDAQALALQHNDYSTKPSKIYERESYYNVENFIAGYNKSQQTHPFSLEDMIDAIRYCLKNIDADLMFSKQDFHQNATIKHHLKIWEEQQYKTIYYNA